MVFFSISKATLQMAMMKYVSPLFPFLVGWGLLMATPGFFDISLLNGVAQISLFILVACWPALTTGRLSYVDIAWPWGLVLIGAITYTFSDGNGLRVTMISLVYAFVGVRMGLGALRMWHLGYFKTEFPRYQYQRLRWEKSGKTNTGLVLQVEAMLQGMANAGFLALPAFIIGSNADPDISFFEIVGLVLWLLAFTIETIADAQKLKFLKQSKQSGVRNSVCNVGLWRYSRHPNYFAEWLVWSALVMASIPSWLGLYEQLYIVNWLLLGAGLLFIPRMMYTTLVYYTGAVPAEHYSVKKRPAYSQYQAHPKASSDKGRIHCAQKPNRP
jgi:steroid 5-alpha reductase family enzyme